MTDKIGSVFFILIIVGFVWLLADFHSDCSSKGGETVRGVIWFKCVGGK